MRSRLLGLCVVGLVLGWAATFDSPGAYAQSPSSGALGRFISSDFWGALVIHPARIAKSPLWAELAKMPGGQKLPISLPGMGPNESALVAQIAGSMDASQFRRLVVLMEGIPDPTGKTIPGMIIQFEQETAEKLMTALAAAGQPGEFKGTKYVKMQAPGGQSVAICAAHPTILLIASEPTLQKMLTPPTDSQPLLDELRRVSLENDVMLAAVAEPLLKSAGAALPPTVKPMVEGLKSASATVNFTGETLLRLDLVALKEEVAMGLQAQLSAMVALGTQQVQAMKASPPAMIPPPLAGALMPVLEEALAGTKINKDATRVTADMKMPSKLPDLVKAGAAMAAAMGSAMPAAKPAETSAEKPATKPAAK